MDAAESSASFLSNCFKKLRDSVAGKLSNLLPGFSAKARDRPLIPPNPPAVGEAAASTSTTAYNKPSLNSYRYLMAGNFFLITKKLSCLPKDLWEYYLGKAGRSEDSTSWRSYTKAYTGAFGSRLPYVTDLDNAVLRVYFKESMLGW